MPRELKLKQVEALLKRPGRHMISPRLYLQVKDTGTASYLFRYMIDGVGHWKGLGEFGVVHLADVRDEVIDLRRGIHKGIDPLAAAREKKLARRLAKIKRKTFGECAAEYVAAREKGWKNDKHAAQWRTVFEGSKRAAAATALINDLPVTEIDTALALEVLKPIWHQKPETASRARQRCEAVLNYAITREYRDGKNPFVWKGHLENLLDKPTVLKKASGSRHHPALPYAELPAFTAELRDNAFVSARALEFLILTATRTNEVISARWTEINLAEGTWTIPSERMKAGKEHEVPLSDRALAILAALPREDGNPYLFVGARQGAPLSNMAMLELMRGMRNGFVPHGFRSTFRDWCAEQTAYPRDVIEHALAHGLKDKTEAAYFRTTLFDKRRQLMAAWGSYCTAPPVEGGNVTPLRKERAS